MTGSKWALTPPFTGIVAKDVVAGLLGHHTVQFVARAAVAEAASRGARVRFVHVVTTGLSAQERDEAVNLGFAAALRALREFPRVPVTFEAAEGEPGPALVECSAAAGILVIAAGEGRDLCDDAAAPDPEVVVAQELAAYCQRNARCDVLTVRPVRDARHTGLASTA